MNLNLNEKTSILIFAIFLLVILVAGCGPSGPVGPVPTNQTPIITSTPITTATVGAAYTYNVTATDPDGNTLTFSLTISPTSMTINSSSGLISWTPTVAGNYNITVEVSDNGSPVKSITQSFTIQVGQPGPANQPPIITSTAITTATVGQAYSYDVDATDPDGDSLTYFLVGPAGMTIDFLSGLITWTPTTSGNYNVTVSVLDGRLFATQSFTITVQGSAASLGQVQLISPSDGATLPPGDITFSWNPISNATKYQFIIYYPLGQVALDLINIGTSLIVTFSAEETFTWKVRAGDNSSNWGAWSNTWNLIIQSTTPVTYTITASASPDGSISPSGSVTVNQGSNKSFTITPDSGYSIDDVLVDGSSVGAVSSYTFTNITQNHTISATFNVAGSGTYPIGGTGPAGGHIFYDKGSYSNGWRYLEAAPASTELTGKKWGSEGTLIGGTGAGIGTGQSNTTTIVTWLNSHSETNRVAQLCDALVYGGYSDWFLPSKDELNLIYTNLHNIVTPVGSFYGGLYYSSSEYNANQAWGQSFTLGYQDPFGKWAEYQARAIRAF